MHSLHGILSTVQYNIYYCKLRICKSSLTPKLIKNGFFLYTNFKELFFIAIVCSNQATVRFRIRQSTDASSTATLLLTSKELKMSAQTHLVYVETYLIPSTVLQFLLLTKYSLGQLRLSYVPIMYGPKTSAHVLGVLSYVSLYCPKTSAHVLGVLTYVNI